MKKTLPTLPSAALLVYTFLQALVPTSVLATPKGMVNCTLELHSGRQTYTYVFSGVVSHHGHPAANARIQLQVSTPNRPDQIQETIAAADGRYQMTVSVAGKPSESADWKLVAQALEDTAVSAEIEGRSILMDVESTVLVKKPLQLVQG